MVCWEQELFLPFWSVSTVFLRNKVCPCSFAFFLCEGHSAERSKGSCQIHLLFHPQDYRYPHLGESELVSLPQIALEVHPCGPLGTRASHLFRFYAKPVQHTHATECHWLSLLIWFLNSTKKRTRPFFSDYSLKVLRAEEVDFVSQLLPF